MADLTSFASTTELDRIVDDLKRAVDGDSWQGPAIREILAGMSAADAASYPVPGAHSIWELVYHVTAWVGAVHQRVLGRVCELSGESDWPAVRDSSERAWTEALDTLDATQAELFATLKKLTDRDLTGPVPNRGYDRAHLLHGLAHHHAYHAGQMALLKRAMQER